MGSAPSRISAASSWLRAIARSRKLWHKERKLCMQGRLRRLGLGGRVKDIPLPRELVSEILGRLRPRDLCRAAAVCKAWRREVTSPEFVRHYHSDRCGGWMDAPTLALLSAHQEQPSVAFSTELKRWVRTPTLFFHGIPGRRAPIAWDTTTRLVAQAKGLYVFSVTGRAQIYPPEKKRLVVSNPLTGATKWLPPALQHSSGRSPWGTSVMLDILEEGAAYRMTSVDSEEQCVEVYDSRSGCWTVFEAESMRSSLDTQGCHIRAGSRSVVLSGNVYFVASSFNDTDTIVSFNFEDRKWRRVYDFGPAAPATTPRFRTGFILVHLVTCDDKLIVVQLKNDTTRGRGAVYYLDLERKLLVHETRLPKRVARRMVPKCGYVYPMIGQGHYLCSCNTNDGSMVLCDFRTKEWEEWPACRVRPVLSGPHIHDQLVDLQFGLLPIPSTRK